MDLGLRDLTDDQLLELVEQTCQELAARDPYVRQMAQGTITTEAERLAAKRKAVKEAITDAMAIYIQGIRTETAAEVRAGVKNGTIRLLTPAQEARVAVDSTFEAKIKLIDETVAAIQGGSVHKAKSADPDTYEELRLRAHEAMNAIMQQEAYNRGAAGGAVHKGAAPPQPSIVDYDQYVKMIHDQLLASGPPWVKSKP